jgi:large subunit ribosomal protein L15
MGGAEARPQRLLNGEMAEKKKAAASTKSTAKAGAKKSSAKSTAPKAAKSTTAGKASIATAGGPLLTLGAIKPAKGSWPKRTRVGRGHGSGMVKTGGEGGKGQTVRSGGGKGPAFEGGQTPWQRRLPHRRGYSQKARDIGHFRTTYTVVNLHDLADWDTSVEVTPQTLKIAKKIKQIGDGVKILGGGKTGKAIPSGLRFRDVLFSNGAREALAAAGASIDAQ